MLSLAVLRRIEFGLVCFERGGSRLHSLASYPSLERRHLHLIQSAANRRGVNAVVGANLVIQPHRA